LATVWHCPHSRRNRVYDAAARRPSVRPVAAAEEQLKQYPKDIAKHRLAIDVFAIDYTPHSHSTFELHATAVSRH